jgi:hypothetical protein
MEGVLRVAVMVLQGCSKCVTKLLHMCHVDVRGCKMYIACNADRGPVGVHADEVATHDADQR